MDYYCSQVFATLQVINPIELMTFNEPLKLINYQKTIELMTLSELLKLINY
jgi:hypothetical protein